MKIKIDAQLRTLAALKDRVRDQVTEMQRLEVECAWNLTLKKQGKDGVFLLQSKEEVLYMEPITYLHFNIFSQLNFIYKAL